MKTQQLVLPCWPTWPGGPDDPDGTQGGPYFFGPFDTIPPVKCGGPAVNCRTHGPFRSIIKKPRPGPIGPCFPKPPPKPKPKGGKR